MKIKIVEAHRTIGTINPFVILFISTVMVYGLVSEAGNSKIGNSSLSKRSCNFWYILKIDHLFVIR
jgi:hypothetical protein